MADRSGQRLGNYHLTRSLGQGGFAEVYLGQHIYLKTQAAIKVLMTQLSGDDTESFLNEARTIAGLLHPNIVRVLDFGIDDKTPYLVMDYAPNGTMRQRYPKKTRLEPAIIASYVKQIAGALQYAHDQKLIHRDIKPENLLIGRHNELLLSDFGIALVAQSSRYQNTQDVVGTVAYMSPEQIQGKARPSSDQYSLGIIVYEWLCGERPFQGSFTELCTQHMFASPMPLHERVVSISPAIEQVVNIALAKDPKQRFVTIQAFANALEQATSETFVVQNPLLLPSSPSPSIPSVLLPPTIVPTPSPSSLAPTQLASMAAIPPITPHIDDIPSPLPASNYTQPMYEQAKENHPRVGINRLVAMILSTLLFTLCNYGLDAWILKNSASSASPNPTASELFFLYFTPVGILFGLIITIPLFVAVEVSPWIGLASIIIGNILGDYIAFHQLSSINWYYYVANVLQVGIPGFILFRWIHAPNPHKILRVLFWTAMGILVSSLIVATGDAINFHYSLNYWLSGFLGFMLSNFAGFIAFLILIVVYGKIVQKKKA
jgi:serine/threonine protein kinase